MGDFREIALRIDSCRLQILEVNWEGGASGGGVTPRHCRGEADEEEGRGKMPREEGRNGDAGRLAPLL